MRHGPVPHGRDPFLTAGSRHPASSLCRSPLLASLALLMISARAGLAGDLVVVSFTTLDTVATYDNVLVESAGLLVVNDSLFVTHSMTVRSGGGVTHGPRNIAGLYVKAGETLAIEVGGRIDAGSAGLRGGSNGSAFGLRGECFDDRNPNSPLIVSGSGSGQNGGCGGSHGGSGGSSGCDTNLQYGIIERPAFLGSGGGSARLDRPAGNGGGLIHLVAGACIVDGSIRADGGDGTDGGGGGSGGSVLLEVETLSGTGSLSANGGRGSFSVSGGNGGGGGRIAILADGSITFPAASIVARGGIGVGSGGPGTIYLHELANAVGTLIVDGANIVPRAFEATQLRTRLTAFRSMLVRGGAELALAPTADSLQTRDLRIEDDMILPAGTALQLQEVHLSLGPPGHGLFRVDAGATLEGGGTITATRVINRGSVDVQLSSDRLDVVGDFEQGSGGVTTLMLTPGSLGPENQALGVSGGVTLAGALFLIPAAPISSISLAEGQGFPLLHYSSIAGALDSISTPALPPTLRWEATYGTAALTGRVTLAANRTVLPAEPVEIGAPATIHLVPPDSESFSQASLFYRPGSELIGFRQIPMTARPAEAGLFAEIPGDAITEFGIDYYVLYVHAGIAGGLPPSGADAPYSLSIRRPSESGSLRTQAQSASGFQVGDSVTVLATPSSTSIFFVSGTLHYRSGGASTYESVPLTVPAQFPVPQGVIPGRTVGTSGIEYWVEAQTLTDTLHSPAADWLVHPNAIRTRIPRVVEASVQPGGRYRMVGFPLEFGPGFSGTLATLLADVPGFGPYLKSRWRAFRYQPTESAEVELTPGDTLNFRPRPGMAFWLISASDHRIDFATLDGLSTRSDVAREIALAPGWNQIADPFDFPVSWEAVVRNSAIGTPIAFNPRLKLSGDYEPTPATVLEPFMGYFVENTADTVVSILVPPVATSLLPAPAAIERATATGEWTLRVEGSTRAAEDGANWLGARAQAADGPDALDERKPPPPPGPWLRLGFTHPDWQGPRELYRRDFRAIADGHAWDIELASAAPAEPVTIAFTPQGTLPEGLEFRLVDREQGSVQTLDPSRGPATCRVLPYGGTRPYRLTLLAGSASWLDRDSGGLATGPIRVTLRPCSPSPVRSGRATRLRFGLPRPARVTLEAFDVAGRRVARILDRAALEAGWHALVWEGRADGGRPLASGVYLLRLSADRAASEQRLPVLR